jgi:hypothetical protein
VNHVVFVSVIPTGAPLKRMAFPQISGAEWRDPWDVSFALVLQGVLTTLFSLDVLKEPRPGAIPSGNATIAKVQAVIGQFTERIPCVRIAGDGLSGSLHSAPQIFDAIENLVALRSG